ncbi:MAG: glycerol kinase GlpK [Alphaproteobacteria bacterium]
MADATGILAIDQGTTSSRAMLFGLDGRALAVAQQEFPQLYPADGWVEHDPEAIWSSIVDVTREALGAAADQGVTVAAVGVTNQRETTLVWDRETGEPIHNAIVWQDRRTADVCQALRYDDAEAEVQARSGLLLDAYFSATKVAWILDHVKGARARAERGELAFGTVDSFLIWRLTGGTVHATDATNASRTSLYNIHKGEWDDELLRLFRVPPQVLPEVRDSAGDFGTTDASVLGAEIPISGVAGDQQAATVGQACFQPGDIKSTYGTGCFVMLNTGNEAVTSSNRLLTTIAYQLDGQPTYALEGSIFIAGAAVQWLRDGLGIIGSAAETEALAKGLDSNGGVYLVPAFTGLGAPYWDPRARGAIYGLTRDAGRAEIARAALEAAAYQTSDLMTAMAQDGVQPNALKVDGGMVANSWLCQFLADILNLPVDRPQVMETTVLGAAYLAGLGAGVYSSVEQVSTRWELERRFEPTMEEEVRDGLLMEWGEAIGATISY